MSTQDCLFLCSAILNIGAIVGSIMPGLPGPPLGFVAMLLCCIAVPTPFMIVLTVLTGLFVLFLTILDYILPAWITNKAGGSKWASVGATIGLIIGLFYAPWGLLVGPFLGASIGELCKSHKFKQSLLIGAYSMLSLAVSTIFKLIACVAIFLICIVCTLYYYLG